MSTNELPTSVLGLVDSDEKLFMVLSTARPHGLGVRRLPDRDDRGRRVVSIQVESDEQARSVLDALDRRDREFYVDVERKQDLHLESVARDTVRLGRVHTIKPNDITIDALDALLEHHVNGVADKSVTVVGTGNLGFKTVLRLAERGARVSLTGRDHRKAQALAAAVNMVLPSFTPHQVEVGPSGHLSDILICAITAKAVIDAEWISRLSPHALCVDVGIGNFTEGFIARAHDTGHHVVRLDVRSAGDPLPRYPNPFFTDVAGERCCQGMTLVAGGLMGRRGHLVVDNVSHPTQVIGVADGVGGLIPEPDLPEALRSDVQRLRAMIHSDKMTTDHNGRMS